MIIHGVAVRKETKVQDDEQMEAKLTTVVDKLQELSKEWKTGTTYKISRTDGGQLIVEETEDKRSWTSDDK